MIQDIFMIIFGFYQPEAFGILWIYIVPFIIVIALAITILVTKHSSELVMIEEEFDNFTKPSRPRKKTILIVDDSMVVRKKFDKLLGQSYDILHASNGQEALEYLEKYPIDILITDLQMPVMDGFELISTVKGSINTENIPIIAITAHEDLNAKIHQIQRIYGFFNKPWNGREMLKRVEALSKMTTLKLAA